MTARTFTEIMNRKHLDQLEHDVMSMTFELEEKHGCRNMDIVFALLRAADTLAKREWICAHDSLDYHVIERCKRNLDRVLRKFS